MGKVAIITGVNGQDGSILSDFLTKKEEYDLVVGIQRRISSPTDWRLKELDLYSRNNFKACSGDVIDPGCIDRLVCKYQPDEFYHLAAQSFVKESWNTPSATHQINTIGTINCLEAIRHRKSDCRFYFAASSEMFGGANRVEILDEESAFYPRSPYGVSKVAGYYSTINYRESYDMFCCNGILFNHESPWRGIEFVTRKITDGVARIKLGLQETISLGNIEAKRDWGDSRDFVRAMWLMLQRDTPDDFVISTGDAYSIKQFVSLALSAAGLHPRDLGWGEVEDYIVQDERFMRPADVGHLLGDNSKARCLLGWVPNITISEMVQDMVDMDIRRIKNGLRSTES